MSNLRRYSKDGTVTEHPLGPFQLDLGLQAYPDLETAARYHINITDYPICLTRKRADRFSPRILKTQIHFQDEELDQQWKLVPSAEHGLPPAAAQKLWAHIFHMWKQQGCPLNGVVQFGNPQRLLRELHRTNRHFSGKDYQDLLAWLQALVTTSITALNCFFDLRNNRFLQRVLFHPLSEFTWVDDDPQFTECFLVIPQALIKYGAANQLKEMAMTQREFLGFSPQQIKVFSYVTKYTQKYPRWHIVLEEFCARMTIEVKCPRKRRFVVRELLDSAVEEVKTLERWELYTMNSGKEAIRLYSTNKNLKKRRPKSTRIELKDPEPGSREAFELEKLTSRVGDKYKYLHLVALAELGVDRFCRAAAVAVDVQGSKSAKDPGAVVWSEVRKLAKKEWGIDLEVAQKTKYRY